MKLKTLLIKNSWLRLYLSYLQIYDHLEDTTGCSKIITQYFTWLFWYHNVTRCISSNTLSDRIRILEHPVGRLILSHSWDIYVNLTVDMSVCLWNQSWIILKIMTAYFAYRSYTYIEYIFGMKLLTYAL